MRDDVEAWTRDRSYRSDAWTAAQLVGAWLLVSAGAGITALLLLMTAVQAAQIFSAMALWRIAFPG